MQKERSLLTRNWLNWKKYRFLLVELIRKNIKLQYRNSVLGMLWTLIQPLLTMIVLSVVFSGKFGKGNEACGGKRLRD